MTDWFSFQLRAGGDTMQKISNVQFMQNYYDEKAVTQAAIYLLERHSNQMPYIKLIKLLYLADRGALLETGSSISKDAYVSMFYGPVLSITLDVIRKTGFAEKYGKYWTNTLKPKTMMWFCGNPATSWK